MRIPSAWPRKSPPAALKPSCCAGAKLKPTRIRCCRLSSSKKCPRAKISRVCERCTGAHIQSYCTRRKHSCPIALAPRYSRAFFSGGSACSMSALMATLIGLSDKLARLKSSTTGHNGEATSLVVDFAGYAFPTVARDQRLADQPHGSQQEVGHDLARPRCERLRPVDVRTGIDELRQDRHDRADVPRLRVEPGHADCLLGVELLGGRLFGARCYPRE